MRMIVLPVIGWKQPYSTRVVTGRLPWRPRSDGSDTDPM